MIFSSSRATTDFKNILLLIELCFSVPAGNTEPERLFSRLKRYKTDSRYPLGSTRLEYIVRSMDEGPSVKDCDVLPDMAFEQVVKSANLHSKNEIAI